jgi:hypothetical protein
MVLLSGVAPAIVRPHSQRVWTHGSLLRPARPRQRRPCMRLSRAIRGGVIRA